MNGPIVSIAKELGFEGNSFLEGLVVSIFIGGALIGSISCGSLVDKLGCRRTFQLVTIPLILGAIVRLVFFFFVFFFEQVFLLNEAFHFCSDFIKDLTKSFLHQFYAHMLHRINCIMSKQICRTLNFM